MHGIPYHHIPINKQNKPQAFAEIAKRLAEQEPEVIVLARFMQIMPPDLCAKYADQIINIHHGFLPSFSGAKPYHAAYDHGVKLIGATCHYVTQELDAGPIIEQDVIRVNHADAASKMVTLGRDVERNVLSRGLGYHLEDRVIVHNNKTVVFK
jgi:formyltetrahydrofolate deformylase